VQNEEGDGSHDVKKVLNEIEAIFAAPDDEDDEGYDCHEREIIVALPKEASAIYNAGYISIPIRDVLTWCADRLPGDAERLLALRDDFYGGNDEFDYNGIHIEQTHGLITPEMRARLAVERRRGRPARDEAARALQAEMATEVELNKNIWGPFLEEGRRLEMRREADFARVDDLDSRWEALVEEFGDTDIDADPSGRARKAELLSLGSALAADQWRWSEDRRDLLAKVHEYENIVVWPE
jgi:hypothetical protein